MNHSKTMLIIPLTIILLAFSACGPAPATVAPSQGPDLNTIIAETAQAAVQGTLTQVALSRPSDTPMPTFTETPIQTVTSVPLPTSNKPMISVSKETNCRLGPDTVYERVGKLDPGIMAEVFGLDPTRNYYFIENTSKPGTYCWVWGFFATQVNSFVGLPIYTPAYTPIPFNTSTPGLTTTATATGTITTTGACTLVSLSPPNNKQFEPGEEYIDLNWTVKNSSTTAWAKTNVSYKFVSGTNLHKVTIYNLPADIAPGTNSTLLLDLVVPATNGTHTETWALVQGTTTLCSLTFSIVVAP